MRAARVRLVFTLPEKALRAFFPTLSPNELPPRHLAYVEWMTKFGTRPERDSRMYKVKWATSQQNTRLVSIIPVSVLQRSVQLIPKWGGPVPLDWTSETVLDACETFLLNPYRDNHTYFNVY